MAVGALVPADPRSNNFDVLRITAAVGVLVSHAFILTGGVEPGAPGSTSLGGAGVLCFFGISGYLVTQSWLRDPHVGRFATRRALRIYPALLVVLLLTALVLGPIATTLSLRDYVLDIDTSEYLVGNLLMVRASYDLPGVFTGVPFPDAVNGSLWSLRPEMHAYIAIAALGLAGALRTRATTTAAALVLGALLILVPGPIATAFGEPAPLLAFVAGALLLVWRDALPWRWPLAAALLVAAELLPAGAGTDAVTGLAYAYAVLMLGYRTPAVGARLLRGRDVSYGTYLYAFPVQQCIVALVPGIGAGAMIALALPITLLLAAGSWRFVERPALARKARLVDRRPALADAAPVAAAA